VPRHPSFLLKLKIKQPYSTSLSLSLSLSIFFYLSLTGWLNEWETLRARLHFLLFVRACSKLSSFSQSVSMRDYIIYITAVKSLMISTPGLLICASSSQIFLWISCWQISICWCRSTTSTCIVSSLIFCWMNAAWKVRGLKTFLLVADTPCK